MDDPSEHSRDAARDVARLSSEGLSGKLFGEADAGGGKFAAASKRERDELLHASIEALERIPYLKFKSGELDENPRSMIHIVLTARGSFPAESIQADIRSVWTENVVRDRTALHVFKTTIQGFDFHFAILELGVFLTGVYTVVIGLAPPD